MRLIDEDKAKEVLTDYYHISTNIQRLALEEAFSRVPTVDAIPIEWIEKWGYQNGMSESMSLRVMIDDWKKEK